MAIKSIKNRTTTTIEIDLTGPAGNAFSLLKLADDLGKRAGYDKDTREQILMEMKLTDYEGLLHTFDREFGSFVTMWR
jgi:hypothetical protein